MSKEGAMKTKKLRQGITGIIRQIVLIAFAVIVLFPLAYVIAGSLKENRELRLMRQSGRKTSADFVANIFRKKDLSLC